MIEICRKCKEPYVLNEERYSPGERVERVCQGCGEVIVFNIPKPERAEPEHVASSATPTMPPPASPPVATPEPVVPAPPPASSVPPPTPPPTSSVPPPTQSAPASENNNQNKTVLISIIAVLVVVLGVVLYTNSSRTSTTAHNEVSDSIAKAAAVIDSMAVAEDNIAVDTMISEAVEALDEVEAQDLRHRITTVKGNRVNLREYASTSSRVIGQLNTGDEVQIISGSTESSQSNSGILTRSVTLYNSSGHSITLNKGKAVHIQGYSDGKVKVSFDNGNSTLSATIDPSDVENIASETWIQVETMSGKVGWILSRFLNINI